MKILMIDDHPLILAAMQNVVQGLGDHVQVTAVETAEEARAQLADGIDVDLILLDLFLNDGAAYPFLAELRAGHPSLPVVVVSASESPADVIRCIDGGAMGFVPKRASNEMLFEALVMVMAGGIYVPPMAEGLGGPDLPSVAQDEVFPGLPARGAPHGESSGVAAWYPQPIGTDPTRHLASGMPIGRPEQRVELQTGATSFEGLGLTPRQLEVLLLLMEGKANKVIARELGLSVETIKDHVAAVLRCLGVSSRTQAVLAVRHLQQPGGRGGARH
ncbi:MAG: response regulator [Leptothrix sp. (in: b-proteobacteria)]